ncbi:MAG TPA: hypothetical protein VHA35_12760 [Dongiaceae bacterium]|nr:hypothetical protein [Dongiaceae bacterium]
MAIAPSIDEIPGTSEPRALLVKIPDDWTFRRFDDQRYTGDVETVAVKPRDPDGVPPGRYLRVAVDQLIDPWGRVAVGMEFDTPAGVQRAELSLETQDEALKAETHPPIDGIEVDAKSLLALDGGSQSLLFVEGRPGDTLDLSDDPEGRWSGGDTDGTHTLYIRRDDDGRRTATLAVRNAVAVKLD